MTINIKLIAITIFIIFSIMLVFPKQLIAKNDVISGKFTTELFNNNNYESSNSDNEFNNNYARSELSLRINLSKNIYLKTQARLREINIPSESARRSASLHNADNSSFENEGIDLRKLSLNYTHKDNTFLIGKFTTKFGQAWQSKDNIWLFDEAITNYRQDQKIGFSYAATGGHAQKNGQYNLSLATFNNDNKYMNGSIITKRDGFNKSDGIPGDKKGLKSHMAALDIKHDFSNKENLSYHFSYMNLAVNERQSPVTKERVEDQEGYALNMDYRRPLGKNLSIRGFVEYVDINNKDGDSNKDEDFLTTSFSLYLFKNYHATIGRYSRKETTIGANGIDTQIKELSLGYKFKDKSLLKNLQIMAGIKRETIDSKTSKVRNNIAGLLIRYIKEF